MKLSFTKDALPADIKERLTIFDIAGHLGITLKGRGCIYHSPFRSDRKPSFSISRDGKLFNDFATGDRGDIFAFYMQATGLGFCQALMECAKLCGLEYGAYNSPKKPFCRIGNTTRLKPSIPLLEWNETDAKYLEDLRGYSVEAQQIAFERGVFGFCNYKGIRSWIITDGAGNTAQARRIDGLLWEDPSGGHKAETLRNSNCAIPAGLKAVKPFKTVALCEGSTDFLAAFHLAYAYNCEECIAPIAMLGATHSIAQEALIALKGKRVIIYPDADKAGQDALKKWGDQIISYAEKVLYFDFGGFHKMDGSPVKDLSDFMQLDPDEWETSRPYTDPFYERDDTNER